MTDLVVLVLVLVWIAVLTPWGIRRLRESHTETSIDSFHEQLHLLERTGPKLVEPAYRLSAVEDGGQSEPGSPGDLHGPFGPSGPSGADAVRTGAARVASHAGRGESGAMRAVQDQGATMLDRRSRRRRRDVVAALVVVVVLSGVLGSIHSLHPLWVITFLSVGAIAAYVALVAYAQVLNADRDALKPVDQVATAPRSGIDPPWLLRIGAHASEASRVGVEVVESRSSRVRAARSGLPGAWDDDEQHVSVAPRHAAVGG